MKSGSLLRAKAGPDHEEYIADFFNVSYGSFFPGALYLRERHSSTGRVSSKYDLFRFVFLQKEKISSQAVLQTARKWELWS